MSASDPTNDNKPNQKPRSLPETLDQVEQSHRDWASIKAQGQAIADITQTLEQLAKDEDDDASRASGK